MARELLGGYQVGDLIAGTGDPRAGKGKGRGKAKKTKGTGKPAFPQAKGGEGEKESDAQFFSRRPKKEARNGEDFMARAREWRITRRQLAGMMKRERAENSREQGSQQSGRARPRLGRVWSARRSPR
jgi:hypothetical protein